MKKILLLLFSIMIFSPAYSQEINRCGTTEYTDYLIRLHPEVLENMRHIEQLIQSHIAMSEMKSAETVIVVPVVVHVIWNTSAQNISEQMITSQIRVLTEDFRRMYGTPGWNTNPVGSDVKVEFRLADRDPNGLPHTGINRVYTTRTSFNYLTDDSYLKGLSYWPSTKYLNLWTANLSGGLLGYAQFPGGPAATDGVVIQYNAFGYGSPFVPYNLGRSATHEIGHWFNLIHIWGDVNTCYGTDYCNDTPPCSGQYFSGYPSCPAPAQCNSIPRMIQNYMDYSDDGCMNLYTIDQTTRVRAAISVYRSGLQASYKEKFKITQTGVDYNFTDFFSGLTATLNFSTLGSVDSVTVEVFPNLVPLNIPAGSKAVKRYFNITAQGTGYSANMKLYYKDAEVVGFNNGENNLSLYKLTTGGWLNMGGTVNTALNYVALDNVTEFSTWAFGDPTDSPIPVELTSFTADVYGSAVNLYWQTATETNNQGFIIERALTSKDYRDVTWKEISNIRSSGNSTETNKYSFRDADLNPGTYLYRLKIIDLDGTFKYSDAITAVVEVPNVFVLGQNYPNPFNPATTINFSVPTASFVSIKVYDALGREAVVLLSGDKEPGNYQVNFDASDLPSGIYYYTMLADGFAKTNKMLLLK